MRSNLLALPAVLCAAVLSACSTNTATTGAGVDYAPGDSYRSYCFTFDDGVTECGTATDKTWIIHDMSLHISCSDDFPDGYGEKGQPTESFGDPRVVDYSIEKIKVEDDGSLTVESSCGDTVATEIDCEPDVPDDYCWDFGGGGGDGSADGGTDGGVCPDYVTDTWSDDVTVWCFEFADGWSDCGETEGSSSMIHDMVVHTSCSADYDADGYPDKDHPVAADGEPAVVDYSIVEYKFTDGVCDEVRVKCGDLFDVVPEECPVVPECISLSEAYEAGDAIISSDDGASIVITNNGDIDICMDAWYAMISPGNQDGIIGSQDAGVGNGVVPAGGSFTMQYGSYTTDNGVFSPDLGDDAWWCLEFDQGFASGFVYSFDGAELPQALTRFWLEEADRDGDGVDDRVDWVDVQGVEAQYQLWAYLDSSAVWLIGQSDHYSYLTEGETVPVELIATNLGAAAGTGTVSWTVPSGLVPLSMSHTPDSITTDSDGATTYMWSVSADGRNEGGTGDGYTYNTDVISLDLFVMDLSCTGREDGIVPTLDWTDSAGESWTSSGTALVLECCDGSTSSYDITGEDSEGRKWWKDHFKKVRDGDAHDHMTQDDADMLMAEVNSFFLNSSDHGADAPYTLTSYQDAYDILNEDMGEGETAKLHGELLAAELNYFFGFRMDDEDANLALLQEAELMAWNAALYDEDTIKDMKDLLKDLNSL